MARRGEYISELKGNSYETFKHKLHYRHHARADILTHTTPVCPYLRRTNLVASFFTRRVERGSKSPRIKGIDC
jgi:hypothetical protein